MQVLINDLLAYSRVGSQGGRAEPTDTSALVDQVLADPGPLIDDAGAQVTRAELPVLSADARQLAQVFQNLVTNTIKYRRAQAPPRVHIHARRDRAMWRFDVSDNGQGIEPQYRERIFVLFQRLHTREESSRTGIGLAVCKKIVERHGGRIWVESQLGACSTFSFTLPAG